MAYPAHQTTGGELHWSTQPFSPSSEDTIVKVFLLTNSEVFVLLEDAKSKWPPRRKTTFEAVSPQALAPLVNVYSKFYEDLIKVNVGDQIFKRGVHSALDLGAAPGGFAKAAIRRGLRVLAYSLPPRSGGLPFLLKGESDCHYNPVDLRDPDALRPLLQQQRKFKWINMGLTIGAEQKLAFATCEEYTVVKVVMIERLIRQSLRLLEMDGTLFVTLQTTTDLLFFRVMEHCIGSFESMTFHLSARPASGAVVVVMHRFTGASQEGKPKGIDQLLPHLFPIIKRRLEELYTTQRAKIIGRINDEARYPPESKHTKRG